MACTTCRRTCYSGPQVNRKLPTGAYDTNRRSHGRAWASETNSKSVGMPRTHQLQFARTAAINYTSFLPGWYVFFIYRSSSLCLLVVFVFLFWQVTVWLVFTSLVFFLAICNFFCYGFRPIALAFASLSRRWGFTQSTLEVSLRHFR